MTSATPLRGAVRLPTEMLIAKDALGHQFEVEVGPAAIKVTVPALPSEDPEEWYKLVCPLPDADDIDGLMGRVDADEDGWGGVAFGRNPGHPRILASLVRALAVEATFADAGLAGPHAATALGDTFDDWWSNVLTWLELWTPQHLNPDANAPLRSRGHVYDMRSNPPQLTGWGLRGEMQICGSKHAITRAMLASAMSRAARGCSPPLQWRLFCQAQRLRDHRQALMNAAAAAEIALAECVHIRLGHASEPARERITKNANGLVGLLQLVEELDALPSSNSRRARVADRVAAPRNDTAHRGMTPSTQTLDRALQEVRELLDTYTPSPRPD